MPTHPRLARRIESAVVLIAAVGLVLTACATATSASPSPAAPPTASPPPATASTASPSAGIPDPLPAKVSVTFQVGDEQFKALLDKPESIRHAYELLAGDTTAMIPVGKVVRGSPDGNAPWTWHLDPATFEWADVTVEVCDGLPSFVEAGTITSDTYCPWSAKVISVDAA